jgi:hypothetical protein
MLPTFLGSKPSTLRKQHLYSVLDGCLVHEQRPRQYWHGQGWISIDPHKRQSDRYEATRIHYAAQLTMIVREIPLTNLKSRKNLLLIAVLTSIFASGALISPVQKFWQTPAHTGYIALDEPKSRPPFTWHEAFGALGSNDLLSAVFQHRE